MPDSNPAMDSTLAQSPELSVVLCTHNGADTISEQLDALLAQTTSVRWELVVVDNRSTDDTTRIVEEYRERGAPFRIVPAWERAGLSYARNVGVNAASSDFVAFCDDDDLVGDGWLDAIFEGVSRHRFVASRMEYEKLNSADVMRGRARFQSTELATMFGYMLANGAGFAIERELWNAVGGNDESLVRTGEDFDFSIRVQRTCGVEPTLAAGAVYHYRQRTGYRASFRQGRLYGGAHVMLYHRHGIGRDGDVGFERRRAARDWWWLLTRGPLALAPKRREAWARRFGLRLGRLLGSIEQRCWYP